MDLKTQIRTKIGEIIKELYNQEVSFSVDVPEFAEQGDYSTNAALILAKPLGKSPQEIGAQIKEALETGKWKLETVDKVELAGPGFVNIFISQKTLFEVLHTVEQQKETFGMNDSLKDIKVITEFTDPNPFKEFHIGHLYSNTIGEAISRLIEAQGAEVRRVNYGSDVGLHIAKALYGIPRQDLALTDMENKTVAEKAKFLGAAYALGSAAFEENEQAKAEIIELNKQVYSKDPGILEAYEKGKAWSLEYFENIYERLGMKFDKFYMESEVGEDGRKIVLGYLEKGVFEESDGAVIFPGKKYGLHDRVFINSLGLPTYEAKELGLAPAKYEYFPYDRSIVITGNEINEYFKVLLKALSIIRPELAEKTLHIGHGMVRLPEGKMSSRTGKVITGEWLLNEAKKRASDKVHEQVKHERIKNRDYSDVAEKVGVGAIKYAFLKSGIGGDISFSFEESISFEGNAGPYLQYTYVRTKSLLDKAKLQGMTPKIVAPKNLSEDDTTLLKHLVHYPEIVAYAAETYSPNHVCEYLFQLAQKFNLFYANQRIIQVSISDGENVTITKPTLQLDQQVPQFRLALTQAVGQVLENGLNLLGIKTVVRM